MSVGKDNETDALREALRIQEKVLKVIWLLGSRRSIGPYPIYKTSQYPHKKFLILLKHIKNFTNGNQGALNNISGKGESVLQLCQYESINYKHSQE